VTRETDDDAISRTHDLARELDLRIAELSRHDPGSPDPVGSGYRAAHVSASAGEGAADARRRKREELANAHVRLLRMLDDQIASLEALRDDYQRRIDDNEKEIGRLEAEVGELERLDRLAESGELDPSNPEHARLLAAYGIDPDLSDEEMRRAMSDEIAQREDRQTALRNENERLGLQKDDVQRRIDALQARRTQLEDDIAAGRLSLEQADAIADELDAAEVERQREARQTNDEQLGVQGEGEVAGEERDTRAGRLETHDAEEYAVAAFAQGFAEAKTIEDVRERLIAERQLVETLRRDAPDAERVLAFNEEYEHLFAEGYFDAPGDAPGDTEDAAPSFKAPSPA
jgi:hypothetical protein